MRKKKQFRKDEIALGGDATDALLYLREGYWQIRIYLEEEGKYLRKSLRTQSRDIAIERGMEVWREVERDKLVGRKQFGITIEEGIDKYLEARQREVTAVEQGVITAERFVTIKAQLKNFRTYMQEHRAGGKLSDIEKRDTWNYFEWRRRTAKKAPATSTLINEKAMINACIRYLFETKEIGIAQLEFPKIRQLDRNDTEAATFTESEYKKLYTFTRYWHTRQGEMLDEQERVNRQIFHNWVLIAANTGMRLGEQIQLRWENVSTYDDEEGTRLAQIRVLATTTKVRKERTFIAYNGQYFDRLREITGGTGFVFSIDDGETHITKRVLRRLWAEALAECGIDESRREVLVPYSLRHYFITTRYNKGAHLGQLARLCGTSIEQINKTYYHLDRSEQERVVKIGRL